MAGAGVVRLADSYPCLADRLQQTPFDPHYFFRAPGWLVDSRSQASAACGYRFERHVDQCGQRVPTVFVDYRHATGDLPGIESSGW
jgi:hypothetical protein